MNAPTILADDAIKTVYKAIDCIKELSICEKREQTARYEIQKQFDVYIKAIEASTKKFEICAANTHEEVMKMLDTVDKLAMRENLDDVLPMINTLLNVVNNFQGGMYSLASQSSPTMQLK